MRLPLKGPNGDNWLSARAVTIEISAKWGMVAVGRVSQNWSSPAQGVQEVANLCQYKHGSMLHLEGCCESPPALQFSHFNPPDSEIRIRS
jgi:hypothetical protein